MDHLVRHLRHISRDLGERSEDLIRFVRHRLPHHSEQAYIMSLALDIQAIGLRIDAVTAALPNDIGAAVAAQKAADDAANAANVQAVSDAASALTGLGDKVTALEVAAGVVPPSPAPPPPEPVA